MNETFAQAARRKLGRKIKFKKSGGFDVAEMCPYELGFESVRAPNFCEFKTQDGSPSEMCHKCWEREMPEG